MSGSFPRFGRRFGMIAVLANCLWFGGTPSSAHGAEIVLQVSALDKLVKRSLFNNENGRHYLKEGACYAYLEEPTTTLKGGRVWVRAHLSSRLGIESGGACIGPDFAGWIDSSGQPTAVGSSIRLNDVRVETVDNQSLETLLDAGLLPVLPNAVDLDLRTGIQQLLGGVGQDIQATVESVSVQSVTVTDGKQVSVVFDFRLTGS